jgi:hypothetical protein
MTHDAKTNMTCGLLQGLQKSEIEGVLDRLKFWKEYASCLSLLPTILIDMKADEITKRIGACHQALYDIEMNTGLHHYTRTQQELADKEALLNIELDTAMRNLSGIVARLASGKYNCGTLGEMLNCLEEWNRWRGELGDSSTCWSFEKHQHDHEIHERVQYLQARFKGIEIRSTYLSQRAQGQIQSVRST